MPSRVVLVVSYCLLGFNHEGRAFQSSTGLSSCHRQTSAFVSAAGWSTNNIPCLSQASSSRRKANRLNLSALFSKETNDNDFSGTMKNGESASSDLEGEKEEKGGDLETLAKQFKAFREMAWPYFNESSASKWLFAGMVGMTLLNSGVSVAFSYVGKDFWSALSSKDPEQFTSVLIKYSAALVAGAPVSVLYRFQREKLAVEWRKWMTERVLSLYYNNRVYYSLERNSENGIDNPDQRIAEDVRSFTAFSLQLFLTCVTSVIDLVSFSIILYSIQPQLFGAIIAYAAFGTITTTALGRKLVGLNFEKLVKEADFRYSLVRIRENAESIAFYGGEDIEGKEVDIRFDKVINNKKEIIRAQRNLEFFTNAYQYLVQVVPVSVVAPQYFAGKVELGVVSQSAGAFNHILNDLSVIVNQFEQLSTFSAGIDRLSQFMEAIKDADPDRVDAPLMKLLNATENTTESGTAMDVEMEEIGKGAVPTNIDTSTIILQELESNSIPVDPILQETLLSNSFSGGNDENTLLSMHDVSVVTPDRKRTLVTGLNFALDRGQHLLIVGNSGAGKSSLLRAVAGLWTAGSGTIVRPSSEDLYFLPQRPYCALGSLKDQLLYPSTTKSQNDTEVVSNEDGNDGHYQLGNGHVLKRDLSDEDLLAVFDAVDLSELPLRAGDGDPIRGLNAVMDWSNILSLGEQQRLAFGRVLVNRPKLVILDEATSALDMETEAKMYGLLQDMAKKETMNGLTGPGTTYISVGHRPSLLNYHDQRLRLQGGEGLSSLEIIDEEILKQNPAVSNL